MAIDAGATGENEVRDDLRRHCGVSPREPGQWSLTLFRRAPFDDSIRRKIKECAPFVPIISRNTQARSVGDFASNGSSPSIART